MGVQINGSEGNVIATKGTYSGNVTIGGTLTYEDVTNIDSVGLVTARTGIEIGARPGVAASISVDGNAIFSGISTFSNTTESSASTNGSVQFDGGVGIVKNLNVGGDLAVTSTLAKITLTDSDSGDAYQLRNNTGSFAVRNATDSRSDITVDGDGKVGISTEAPTHNLDVHSSGNPYLKLLRSGYNPVYIGNAAGEGVIETTGATFIKTGGSERLRIDSNGRLLLGTDTARAVGGESNPVLHIEGSGNTSNSWINITRFQSTTAGPNMQFAKARSNTPGTYTLVQSGDTLGTISFLGADGTDMANYAATIKGEVDGTAASNDMPGRLVFSTTIAGGVSATESMRIDSNGHVTKPRQFHMEVSRTDDQTGYNALQNYGTPMIFTNVVRSIGTANSALNTTNGKITVPVAGVYMLEASAYTSSGDIFQQAWFTEGSSRMNYSDQTANNQAGSNKIQVVGMHYLSANTQVGFKPYGNSTSITIGDSVYHTWFRVTLIG